MSQPQPDFKKALKHEQKGDKLYAKGKVREALAEYQKSESFAPDRLAIYDKLVAALQSIEEEWNEEDFSNSISWTMRGQEIQNPRLSWVHDKLKPEYQEINKLIQKLMVVPTEAMEETLMEEIFRYERKALLPLVHFILSIKKLSQDPEIPSEEPDSELQDLNL